VRSYYFFVPKKRAFLIYISFVAHGGPCRLVLIIALNPPTSHAVSLEFLIPVILVGCLLLILPVLIILSVVCLVGRKKMKTRLIRRMTNAYGECSIVMPVHEDNMLLDQPKT
jgi:hypothetical protein